MGGVGMIGMSYAAVPLYRLYCQASGLGGTATAGHDTEQVATMTPVKDRVIKVSFNADLHASMTWNFRPQQTEIYVVPGETALAFYRAKNPTDRPVIGISTYNVVPFEAGQYFNKIQCFCFEEQRLNPHEEVDMPVFFYIDPEFDEDPRMARVDNIVLSYTFFEAKVACDITEGFLVEINNERENNFTDGLIRDNKARAAWLGLDDFIVEGDFKFSGSKASPDYTNWMPNEPNDYQHNEDCAVMEAGAGGWLDIGCEAKVPFICERSSLMPDSVGK